MILLVNFITHGSLENICLCQRQDNQTIIKRNNDSLIEVIRQQNYNDFLYYHKMIAKVLSLIHIKHPILIVENEKQSLLDGLVNLFSHTIGIHTIENDENLTISLTNLFNNINIYDELNFIYIGSQEFATNILKAVNQMDD